MFFLNGYIQFNSIETQKVPFQFVFQNSKIWNWNPSNSPQSGAFYFHFFGEQEREKGSL